MKRWLLLFWGITLFLPTKADFGQWFENRTLRLDYILSGDSVKQYISLDEMFSLPYWAGRRKNLDRAFIKGNAQIQVKDAHSGKLLYVQPFSTLFQEWQHTDEAKKRMRAFENCLLIPQPKQPVLVTIQLFDSYQRATCESTIKIDPNDIQIRRLDNAEVLPHKYIFKNGDPKDCIDIAIVAEGYTSEQVDSFYKDAAAMGDYFFKYEPFKSQKKIFNLVAVAAPSKDSGTSVPHDGVWKETVVGSQFDTFGVPRYLTTSQLKKLQNTLTGIPYEHIIVLVNSEIYGGGGILNFYMLSTFHNKRSNEVCLHEFGHSFAGLADEYDTDDGEDPYYHPEVEPWEKNITTLHDFSQKWKSLLKENTPVPTPSDFAGERDCKTLGVFEGAGYQKKGVYRSTKNCRMRVSNIDIFCPVCEKAISDLIQFYSE